MQACCVSITPACRLHGGFCWRPLALRKQEVLADSTGPPGPYCLQHYPLSNHPFLKCRPVSDLCKIPCIVPGSALLLRSLLPYSLPSSLHDRLDASHTAQALLFIFQVSSQSRISPVANLLLQAPLSCRQEAAPLLPF